MTINRIGSAHLGYVPMTNLNRADEAAADCCSASTTANRLGELASDYMTTIARQAEQIDSLVGALAVRDGVETVVIRARFGLDR